MTGEKKILGKVLNKMDNDRKWVKSSREKIGKDIIVKLQKLWGGELKKAKIICNEYAMKKSGWKVETEEKNVKENKNGTVKNGKVRN